MLILSKEIWTASHAFAQRYSMNIITNGKGLLYSFKLRYSTLYSAKV